MKSKFEQKSAKDIYIQCLNKNIGQALHYPKLSITFTPGAVSRMVDFFYSHFFQYP
jgi:hypothetical protein